MTHDVTRSLTAQPQHNGRDFLWPASAPDGNALRSFGIHLLVSFEDIVTDLGIDQAGIHGIHADALLHVFERGRPRQADDSVLRGDVTTDTRIACQCAD